MGSPRRFRRFSRLAPGMLLLACLARAAAPDEGSPASATKQPEPLQVPPGVVYCPDVAYCTLAGKTPLLLDLAYPKDGRGPFPGVVCLHGGGWVRGSSKKHVPLCWKLAQEGYVAVSVNYRLATVEPFPAQVHDAKCAVRWLRAHAGQYHLDKDRIGAFGFSSGGHLACLLGTTTPKDGLEGTGGYAEESSRVQAVVSFYGLTDLACLHDNCLKGVLPAFEGNLMKMVLEGFLGGPPALRGDLYARASPITYVSKDAAPTLLVHGTADRKVPLDQSQRYERRLKECGVPVRLLALEGAPHDFTGEAEAQARRAALEFLNQYLKGKATRPARSASDG